MATSEKAVDEWTVDDVSTWLDAIGLGHKSSDFTKASVDGKALLDACDDLTKLQESYGLSGLQVKKIVKSLDKEVKTTKGGDTAIAMSDAVSEEINNSSLKAENESLKDELKELREAVSELKSSIIPKTDTSKGNASMQQQTIISDCCTKAVISGNQTHILTITLSPGQRIRSEPGAMLHMSSWINFETKTAGQALGRFLTGQRIFLTEFFYEGPKGTADTVAFGPDFPAQIVPVKLQDYGGKIVCQKSSLLASDTSINVSVEFAQSFRSGFFGGEGFILQGLAGSGYAFLVGRGVVIERKLRSGEKLRVSTGSLVGFQSGVQYSVETLRGISNVFLGGEGLFVTTLTGPGVVWLESQPLDKLVAQVADRISRAT